MAAVQYGIRFMVHAESIPDLVVGISLFFGWLANFSIFIPLRPWARIVWSVAPGLPYAAVLLLMHAPLSVGQRAASLLYFYPWAAGIVLIHVAHLAEARHDSPNGRLA